MTVIRLNCSSCDCRLDRQEIAAGECIYCQSRQLEAEITLHEQAAELELAAREQEQLWG